MFLATSHKKALFRIHQDITIDDIISFAFILLSGLAALIYTYYHFQATLASKTDQALTIALEKQIDTLAQGLHYVSEKQADKADEDRAHFAQMQTSLQRIEARLDKIHTP